MDQEITDPTKVPLFKFRTFESMERHIKNNIFLFENEQIEDLIKQFENHNYSMAYENMIEFLNNELNSRKEELH